jgi:hypothetical protein
MTSTGNVGMENFYDGEKMERHLFDTRQPVIETGT